MSISWEDWPKELKAIREMKGYTQQEAADLCSVSTRTWSFWEQGVYRIKTYAAMEAFKKHGFPLPDEALGKLRKKMASKKKSKRKQKKPRTWSEQRGLTLVRCGRHHRWSLERYGVDSVCPQCGRPQEGPALTPSEEKLLRQEANRETK